MHQLTTHADRTATATTEQTEVRPRAGQALTGQTSRPSRADVIAALPAALDAAARKTLARAHATSSAAGMCTVHPGVCTDTEAGHFDHYNHDHSVATKSGDSLVDITFVQFSDEQLGASEPVVGICGMDTEDYRADEFHAASASVRKLMDTGDALAERVMILDGKGETALAAIDRKIEGELARLVALVAHRRAVAISLTPDSTPLIESDEEQVSAAAFHLATEALRLSLFKAPDQGRTLDAMRSYVDMARDEGRA